MRDVKVLRPSLSLSMRWASASVLLVAGAAMVFAPQARAQMGPGAHHGPGHHGPEAGPGGPMMMFGGPPEHVARSVDHLLDGLNATDAQRTQIKQIATAAAADLRAQREAGRGSREQGLQIFSAPTVDAAAAEALRAQLQARHDQASKRTLQAMLDIATVLTPEQRARIGARMKERQAVMKDRMERMQRMRPGAPGQERPPRESGKPS